MKSVLLIYTPVLHAGYQQFLETHADVDAAYILGPELIAEFDHLRRKDIRALAPELVQQALQSWQLPYSVHIADMETLLSLNTSDTKVIFPDEDELRTIAEKYLGHAKKEPVSVFLRYDRSQSVAKKHVLADTTVTKDAFAQEIMYQAFELAENSSDWWRQVGAVVVKDGQLLMSGWNHHVPDERMPYVNGDPRGNFHKNDHIEASTALHAEAGLIAQAAQAGTSLAGTDMYVTTFPCPNCAKLIAYSGVKKLYFAEGYSSVDGESVLRSQSVEIVRVTD
ncbi:deaminase [Candidatus Woesebacteria bacterium]|nr:deaminase [Candidatus Woesebacteria bacterium]MCD8506713.1 deaminase [Candidatus Woesebacteria bacterium]MCD8527620.1 deaminase [Candidatus Woesebacteria bacterium]MCD8546408.1 deaminase [Candidatus Woesebacteria bacterium]